MAKDPDPARLEIHQPPIGLQLDTSNYRHSWICNEYRDGVNCGGSRGFRSLQMMLLADFGIGAVVTPAFGVMRTQLDAPIYLAKSVRL